MWKSLLAKNKPAEGERDRVGNKARTRLFVYDLIDASEASRSTSGTGKDILKLSFSFNLTYLAKLHHT
jgi:hypothetical protein